MRSLLAVDNFFYLVVTESLWTTAGYACITRTFPDIQERENVSLGKEMISLPKLTIFAGLFPLVRLTNIYIGHSRVSAGHAGFSK